MKNKEKKKIQENKNKSEEALVTKESFSASFMLFSLLALLMLCTGSSIFGEVGAGIQSFLLSMFGYFAYPIFVGAVYLFFMMLIGKRLVQNRKAGVALTFALVCAALLIHTAVTFSWELEGFADKCFEAGASFATATVTGWLGGLIISGLSALISKVGVIVAFSVLCFAAGYLFLFFVSGKWNGFEKKNAKKEKGNAQTIPTQDNANGNQSMGVRNDSVNAWGQSRAEQPQQNQYVDMRFAQRPGVRLTENGTVPSDSYSFSPFGATPTTDEKDKSLERSYENAREFLFGTGATESYKQNLIFDPHANVNNLPPVEPMQPTSATNDNYVPSYTDHYQNAFNQSTTDTRPTKIVTDTTFGSYRSAETEETLSAQEPFQNSYEQDYKKDTFNNDEQKESFVQPMAEVSSQETPFSSYQSERSGYLDVKSEEVIDDTPFGREASFGRDSFIDNPTDKEENNETDNGGYRRHNYMELFGVDNPQELSHDDLFGRDVQTNDTRRAMSETQPVEEEYGFDRNTSRGLFDASPAEEEIVEERGSRRDGLTLFDEESEDDAYTLRSDFEETSRGFDEAPLTSSRDIGERSRRFEDVDVSSDRRVFDESPTDLPPAVVPETPVIVEQPKPVKPPKPRIPKPYVRMSLDDLDCRDVEPTQNHEEVENAKATIIATLEEFKVSGATIASVTFGPTVTRYNVTLPRGVMPAKVVALDQSISMNLYSEGVNIYPNFRDGVVSVEVPNSERQFVQLGSMLSGDTFVNAKSSSLMFAMGKDVANKKVYGDISKMIHLLVAGASGSGKSVFLGALIISLIYKYSPEELRLILIDPKKTEFVLYNDLPHLMINEIITDANKAVQSLNWAIDEMNRRYGLFQDMSNAGTYVVNLDQYNEKLEKAQRLPKIVIIIDELADLMLAAKKDMEEKIQNLTQKARAAGIHLIVATQRPSTDVITGVIKSNLPTRIAFGVATDVDSRVILDQTGAQKLLGKGDFLYTMQGLNSPVRVQSAFISPEESQKVVNFIKEHTEAYYDEAATAYINNAKGSGSGDSSARMDKDNVEPVYIDALRYVILSGSASISMIQRKCSAGYNKAGKIIEWMEEMGYISPFDGAKARKVLISKEEFESKYGPL